MVLKMCCLSFRVVTNARSVTCYEVNQQRQTGAERYDGHRWRLALSILAHVIKTRQCPADGPVSAAHQDLEVRDITENIQPATNGK